MINNSICALCASIAMPVDASVNQTRSPTTNPAMKPPTLRPPFESTCVTIAATAGPGVAVARSEEHTSELQSLMRSSYAVFCLKKTNTHSHELNQHKQTSIDQ